MKTIHRIVVYEGLTRVVDITTSGTLGEPGVDVRMAILDDTDVGAVAEEFAVLSEVLKAREATRNMREKYGAQEISDQIDLEDFPF